MASSGLRKTRWNSTHYTRFYSRIRKKLKVSRTVSTPDRTQGLEHSSQVLYNPAIHPSLGLLDGLALWPRPTFNTWQCCVCLLSVGMYLQTQPPTVLESAMLWLCPHQFSMHANPNPNNTVRWSLWDMRRSRRWSHHERGMSVRLAFLLEQVEDKGHSSLLKWVEPNSTANLPGSQQGDWRQQGQMLPANWSCL